MPQLSSPEAFGWSIPEEELLDKLRRWMEREMSAHCLQEIRAFKYEIL
jgi:hypothetical protein